jgi:hypothetical protein
MPNREWNGGVCPAQPGLPNLLLLSLERVGVRDPPEYVYREYERFGTPRCRMLIFMGRSTLHPDIEPWFISDTGFRFADTYPKAARKTLRRLRVVYSTSDGPQWDFSHPQGVGDDHGLTE